MGYTKEGKQAELTMEQAAGVEFVEVPSGRKWRLKVCTLGGMWKFNERLAAAAASGDERSWVRFMQSSLMCASPEPGLMVRVRRALGLADYSAKEIGASIPARELPALRDAVLCANIGIDYAEFIARCEAAVKKKSACGSVRNRSDRNNEETTTGETRSERCCCSGDCGHGMSST